MANFAIIRIHVIRRAPLGGTPLLWPFSILGAFDVLTYLGVGVGASPYDRPWKTPYLGVAWPDFAFSILQNTHRTNREKRTLAPAMTCCIAKGKTIVLEHIVKARRPRLIIES